MIALSDAAKARVAEGIGYYIQTVNVTLVDGTQMTLTNEDILGDTGIEIEDATSDNGSFQIGSAIINQCSFTLMNFDDKFSYIDFLDAKCQVSIGIELDDDEVETINKGTFYVVEQTSTGTAITIRAYDAMYKFDKEYSLSSLRYPATLATIVANACSVCGVRNEAFTFPNSTMSIPTRPADDALTFREVISWAAQMAGCYARINRNNALSFGWYDTSALYDTDIDESVCHKVTGVFSKTASVRDVEVTGVKINIEVEGAEGKQTATYAVGTDEYALQIEGNQFIDTLNVNDVLETLRSKLVGLRFRILDIEHLSDPSFEAGDIMAVANKVGEFELLVNDSNVLVNDLILMIKKQPAIYWGPVTYTRFCAGGNQQTRSDAEEKVYRQGVRYNAITKLAAENRKDLYKEKTARELAVEDLERQLAEAPGLYVTTETSPGGGTIYYAHDQARLEDSTIVWKMTSTAIGISTDGGQTYPYGLDVSGTAILNRIYAIGIDAEYVKIGNKSITDTLTDDYYTKTETNTQIDAGIAGFSSTVSATYTTKADTPAVNLCPPVYNRENESGNPFTVNGLTFTRNADGSITVTGTATAHSYYTISGYAIPTNASAVSVTYIDPNKKYRLSGCPSGGGTSATFRLAARCTVAGTTPSASSGTIYNDNGSGVTIPTGYKYVHVFIVVYNGYACPTGGITFYPMFEVGEVTHPYVNPAAGALVSRMKTAETAIEQNADSISLRASQIEESVGVTNLTPFPYVELERRTFPFTANGITFTVNADNTVNANGTATDNTWFSFAVNYNSNYVNGTYILRAGTYTLSGWPSGSTSKGFIRIAFYRDTQSTASGMTPTKHGTAGRVATNFAYDDGAGVTFTTTADYYVRIEICVLSGQSVSNITVKPMLEYGYYKHAYLNPEYNARRLIAEINLSPSTAVISAEHISLAGKTIDLTGEDIVITSDNFSVDADGVVSITDGYIDIVSTNSERDHIRLSYGEYATRLAPAFLEFTRTNGILGRMYVNSIDFANPSGTWRAQLGIFDTTNYEGKCIVNGVELYPTSSTANNGGYVDFHYNNSSSDYTSRLLGQSGSILAIPNITSQSDRRLKNHIAEIGSSHEDFLKALNPVEFEYKKFPGKHHYGLYAQDVIRICESLGINYSGLIDSARQDSVDETEYYSLDYNDLIAFLIKGWQTHEREIARLKGESA